MKKITIIIIISVLICLWVFRPHDSKVKYDSWKDTVEAFGDGTYQILHQVVDTQELNQLSNVKHKQCVITDITNYTVVDNMGYFIGTYHDLEVYCVLDIDSDLLRYYVDKNDKEEFMMVYLNNMLRDRQIELIESYDNFTESERNILEQLKNY